MLKFVYKNAPHSKQDVEYIKSQLKNFKRGMVKQLAKDFDISKSAINYIKNERGWFNA